MKTTFRILVDENGLFSCSLPEKIYIGLSIEKDISSKDFQTIRLKVYELARQYDALNTVTTYHIMYRMAFTNRIKEQIPGAIMSDEIWKKTNRIGSEYMGEADLGLIIDWFPTVKKVTGTNIDVNILKLATESDIYYIENGIYSSHKPFSDLLFIQSQKHWDFNDAHFFEIILNQDTYSFFMSIEDGLVSMISRMLSFLSMDEVNLLALIQQNILNTGSLKLIS